MFNRITASDEELHHYGVPGMKWGVRKNTKTTGGSGRKRKRSTPQKIASGKDAVRKQQRLLRKKLSEVKYGSFKEFRHVDWLMEIEGHRMNKPAQKAEPPKFTDPAPKTTAAEAHAFWDDFFSRTDDDE